TPDSQAGPAHARSSRQHNLGVGSWTLEIENAQPTPNSQAVPQHALPSHQHNLGVGSWKLEIDLASAFSGSVNLLLNLSAIDRVPVAGERLLPGADRLGAAVLLLAEIAEMVLDDRIGRPLLGRGRQRRVGEIELSLLHVRPAEAVEVRRVVG